jgi:serralysin
MTAVEPIDATPTDGLNPWIDTLVDGGRWTDGVGTLVTLTYSLKSGIDPNKDTYGNPHNGLVTGKAWTSSEAAALKAAMNAWSAVTNVSFLQTASAGTADLWYWLGRNADMPDGALGWHEMPQEGTSSPLYGAFNYEDFTWRASAMKPGGNAFVTILHELGHGLGLAHPHSSGIEFPGVTSEFGSFGTYNLNQGIYTTMSYNDGFATRFPYHTDVIYGGQMTPMALDIAAVQSIYGKNMSYHTGSDTYVLPAENIMGTGWACIWDAGGYDRISAGATTRSATIDLRPAALTGPYAGGLVSSCRGVVGGFTIANDVVIESAIGGLGDDRIYGNSVANVIYGKSGKDMLAGYSGNDWLDGGLGDDVLYGGTGIDTVSYRTVNGNIYTDLRKTVQQYTGAAGLDTLSEIENIVTGTGHDRLIGNALANRIDAAAGADRVYALEGNDIVLGGAGDDYYSGGTGIDTLDFSSMTGSIRLNLAVTGRQNTLSAGFDEVHYFENIIGSAAADVLTGNDAANLLNGGNGNDSLFGADGSDQLYGGNGNDIIDGGTAADTMWGGTGNDRYVFDNTADMATESGGQGTDTVQSTVTVSGRITDAATAAIADGSFENFTLLGASAINATGNNAANSILGNAADNYLNGADGMDTMTGGDGADTFVFDSVLSDGNVDTIADFDAGQDRFELNTAIFFGLDPQTELLASQFVTGSEALDTDDRIVFDEATGSLYFDPDGSDTVFAAQRFAIIVNPGIGLSELHFSVV